MHRKLDTGGTAGATAVHHCVLQIRSQHANVYASTTLPSNPLVRSRPFKMMDTSILQHHIARHSFCTLHSTARGLAVAASGAVTRYVIADC